MTPLPTEFPPEILRLWQDAKNLTANDDIDIAVPRAVEPAPTTAAAVETPPSDVAPAVDSEFITSAANATVLNVVMATSAAPCPGALTVSREQQIVDWAPAASGCPPAFSVPFPDVRTPAAAPHGGLLLQFRTDRPSVVVMPAPDADLLGAGVQKPNLSDLPPSTRIHMRRAHRAIVEALGRPYNESLFGLLTDVPLSELLTDPEDYDGGPVRTRGVLKSSPTVRGAFVLTEDAVAIQLNPSPSSVNLLRAKGAEWSNKEVVVTGTFSRPAPERSGPAAGKAQFVVTVSSIEPADAIKYNGPARAMTLEEVVRNPPRGRELVRVVGRYRGNDSFGDLPLTSRRGTTDWVLKDQVFAVWVTGKPPAGDGFQLDSTNPSDSSSWLAVTGTIEERKEFVYLRAERVEMSAPPSDAAKVVNPVLRSGAARIPPAITFVFPVEGVEEATREQQILVQFSKPMDEKSFAGRVQLRYEGEQQSTAFPYMSVTYYPDRNFSVMIEPGSALLPGRTLECVLMPGIVDIDNQPLVAAGATPIVLRWKVAKSLP